MTTYEERRQEVLREHETEKKVRAMDASDIVQWIHELEDRIEILEDEVQGHRADLLHANLMEGN